MSKEQELLKMTDSNSLQFPSPSFSPLTFTPATPPLAAAHTTSCPNGTQGSSLSKTTRDPLSQIPNYNAAQCPIDSYSSSDVTTSKAFSSESCTSLAFDSDGPLNSKACDGANVCSDVYGIDDEMDCLVEEFDDWGESDDDLIDVNELSDYEREGLPTNTDPYEDSSAPMTSATDRVYAHSETNQSDRATPLGSVTNVPG